MAVRRIAVYLSTEQAYSRDMLSGVVAYAHQVGDWDIRLATNARLEYATDPTIDGHVGTVSRDQLPTDAPFVATNSFALTRGLPTVIPDSSAAARIAVDHFHERGFRHLGSFVTGDTSRLAAIERDACFQEIAEAAGCTYQRFVKGRRTSRRWTLDGQFADLVDWLAPMPKPLGVFCTDDEHGWRLITAARQAGFAIPDDIAVLGYQNDHVLCELSEPPLSSIAHDGHGVGYHAAKLLEELMRGADPPDAPIRVPPRGLVGRASTDTFAAPDPFVARAVSFIREHIHENVRVEDVLDHVHVSRSTLHRRFVEHLGRGPGEEIRRVRLELVRRKLLESDAPLVAIAAETGYEHISQLSRDIKKETGHTPSAYRRRFGPS